SRLLASLGGARNPRNHRLERRAGAKTRQMGPPSERPCFKMAPGARGKVRFIQADIRDSMGAQGESRVPKSLLDHSPPPSPIPQRREAPWQNASFLSSDRCI
ncbi:hypothetical protein BaRGS_00004414, partial [Batillaria attramentaria]